MPIKPLTHKPKILLLCDDTWQIQIINNFLKRNGMTTVYLANSLLMSTNVFKKESIDIIIASTILKKNEIVGSMITKTLFSGIPILFFTFDYNEHSGLIKTRTFKFEKHIDLHLLTYDFQKLYSNIIKYYFLKIQGKTRDYLIVKSKSGGKQRIYLEEIEYVRTRVNGCILFCKYGQYASIMNIAKLNKNFENTFIRVSESLAIHETLFKKFYQNHVQKKSSNKIPAKSKTDIAFLSFINLKLEKFGTDRLH